MAVYHKKVKRSNSPLTNKSHFENKAGLNYLRDIQNQIQSYINEEIYLSSYNFKVMLKKVAALRPLVSHPLVSQVYKQILDCVTKKKLLCKKNQLKRNNECGNSKVQTQSDDGNISNKEINTSKISNINKVGTGYEASEGFPLELLTNQNFNMECQESQSGYVKNQSPKKTSENTSALDAVVKRLTPIVFSQPFVENMNNSAINPVEEPNDKSSYLETHQFDNRSSLMNKNFEVVDTNNESFVFVINESGNHFNQMTQNDILPESYSSVNFGHNEVNERANTQDSLITVSNAIYECIGLKDGESFQTNVHQSQSELISGFSRNEFNKSIILHQEINSVMLFTPSSANDELVQTQESNKTLITSQEEKIRKEKTKWIPKWNTLSDTEKVSSKFADKFGVNIFNEPVNSLLNLDKLVRPSNNMFFRFNQEDLERWTPEIERSIQNLSNVLNRLELLDTASHPTSVEFNSDSSDTDDDSEPNYKKWLRNYRKTTRRADVKEKYIKFLNQEFAEQSVSEEEDFHLRCEKIVNSKLRESFKNTLVWFKE